VFARSVDDIVRAVHEQRPTREAAPVPSVAAVMDAPVEAVA
jgi:hypothetical protein